MSLNSVQLYVQAQLDGLQSANLPPAIAYVLPPIMVDIAENPVIIIWGGDLDENRMTLPRLRGEKRVAHMLMLYLKFISQNDPSVVSDFPVFMDAIRTILRTIPLPVPLVDQFTGETTYLLDIGERIVARYDTPKAMAPQGMLLFSATMRVHAAEHISNA